MRAMRTVAGLLNITLGATLILAVATVVNLDFPANGAAYVVGALLAAAGIGILVRASWAAALGQSLAAVGIVLGLALLVGATVSLLTVRDWGGLVSAVLLALGIPVLVASAIAFAANRRARRSTPDL